MKSFQCDVFMNASSVYIFEVTWPFGHNLAHNQSEIKFLQYILLQSFALVLQKSMQYADQYAIHLLLGEGGQANVYLGSKNNQLYALKVYLPGPAKQAAYQIEVDLLTKIHFPHFIQMIDHRHQAKIKLNNKQEQLRPLIVLQLAEGAEMFEFISKIGPFPAEVCRVYIKQLFAAIKYLDQIGICHRDLKPQNILLSKDFSLKISDFGLSRYSAGDHGDYKLKSKVGTEGYKPPEMELGTYTGLQADMFAAGVTLFIMYSGTRPFISTRSHERIYKLIRQKNFVKFWQIHEKNKPPGFFTSSFKRLMNSFFSYDPDRRPTFESLEQDEWMNEKQISQEQLIKTMQDKTLQLSYCNPLIKQIAIIKQNLHKQKEIDISYCCEQDNRTQWDSQEETLSDNSLSVSRCKEIQAHFMDMPECNSQDSKNDI